MSRRSNSYYALGDPIPEKEDLHQAGEQRKIAGGERRLPPDPGGQLNYPDHDTKKRIGELEKEFQKWHKNWEKDHPLGTPNAPLMNPRSFAVFKHEQAPPQQTPLVSTVASLGKSQDRQRSNSQHQHEYGRDLVKAAGMAREGYELYKQYEMAKRGGAGNGTRRRSSFYGL
ncbi:hypothetical protein JCM5296_004129 [Sporobolomyces johnsonii]